MDSCRIWESPGEPAVIENCGQSSTHRQPKLFMPSPGLSSSEFRVGSVIPALDQSPRTVNHSLADRELLIRTVLEAVGARRGTHMDDEEDCGQCFSCGFFGHGVNRCPRLDRSFPYKTPGWSVDVRNGQYRASRMSGEEHDLRRGKEEWFTAVAEVHMSAPVDEEEKLIAQASGQHVVCNTDPGKAPTVLSAPLGDTLVSKPKMHSANKIDLDVIPMVVCPEPLTASVPDVPLDSGPMAGNTDWNPSDYVVPKEDQTSRPTVKAFSDAVAPGDSQSSKYQLQPDRSRYPIPDDIPRIQVASPGNQTVPDFLVDINVNAGGNPVPKLALLELAEHLVSVEHSLRPGYPMPDYTPSRRVCFYDSQTVSDGGNNPVQTAPSELSEHSTSVEDSLRPSQPEMSGGQW